MTEEMKKMEEFVEIITNSSAMELVHFEKMIWNELLARRVGVEGKFYREVG
jgi:hypothetical protein